MRSTRLPTAALRRNWVGWGASQLGRVGTPYTAASGGRAHAASPASDTIRNVSPTLRCGVVGVGRMGRHHAALRRDRWLRSGRRRRQRSTAAKHDRRGIRRNAMRTWTGSLSLGVDAVTVAVPTVHHHAAAEPLLRRGVACLIEKPLARPDVTPGPSPTPRPPTARYPSGRARRPLRPGDGRGALPADLAPQLSSRSTASAR